jgi:Transglutaminase-like superfamily
MARLSKFRRLPAADRRLLLKTVLLVWTVRLGLWLLPFRLMRRLLAKLALNPVGSQVCGPTVVARYVWAVTVACRYVPATTCLTQALVTKMLLGHHGHHASVRIGVARSAGGELQAHAWVESGGRVVIGGSEASLQRYTRLKAANGELW